jgi:tetratricopeptide (TPR) repeat protein
MAQLSPEAIWILKQFSVLPPLSIDGKTFLVWIGDTTQSYKATLQDLTKKGWLMSTDDRNFEMHRLIQSLICKVNRLTYEECPILINNLSFRLNEKEKSVTDKYFFLLIGDSILTNLQYKNDNSIILKFKNNLGVLYRSLNIFDKACVLLEESLHYTKLLLGNNNLDVFNIKSNLGDLYRGLGRFKEALKLLEETLEYEKTIYNSSDISLNITKHNLAILYQDLYKDNEAETLLREIVNNTPNDLSLAIKSKSNLIVSLIRLGKNDEAITILYSMDNPSILGCKDLDFYDLIGVILNMSTAYYELDFIEKSLTLGELGLDLLLKEPYPNYYLISIYKSNLSMMYLKKGLQNKAITLLEEALSLDETYLEVKHPNIGIRKLNLADVYFQAQKFRQSKKLFEEALEIFQERFDSLHAHTQHAQEGLFYSIFMLQQIQNEP